MRWFSALAHAGFTPRIALLIAIVGGGCAGGESVIAADAAGADGQVSHFNVGVLVNQVVGVRLDCLYAIDSCMFTVSGSLNDGPFYLPSKVCTHPTAFWLGSFQYDTGAISGSVLFHVEIFDGNRRKLGQGDTANTAVKPGGQESLTAAIVPDPAAFIATGSCPP
jgi:hypothetical protein